MAHLLTFLLAFTAGGIGGFAIARREYTAPEFVVQRDEDDWEARLAAASNTTHKGRVSTSLGGTKL